MTDIERQMRQARWLHRNNREITAPLDVWTSDIMEALEAQGIEPTPGNISRVAKWFRTTAAAWAKAALQDEKDWKSWIETE